MCQNRAGCGATAPVGTAADDLWAAQVAQGSEQVWLGMRMAAACPLAQSLLPALGSWWLQGDGGEKGGQGLVAV